jgi:hypothetical protein
MRFAVLSHLRRCRLGWKVFSDACAMARRSHRHVTDSRASETGALTRDLIRRLTSVIGAAASQRQRWRNISTKRVPGQDVPRPVCGASTDADVGSTSARDQLIATYTR